MLKKSVLLFIILFSLSFSYITFSVNGSITKEEYEKAKTKDFSESCIIYNCADGLDKKTVESYETDQVKSTTDIETETVKSTTDIETETVKSTTDIETETVKSTTDTETETVKATTDIEKSEIQKKIELLKKKVTDEKVKSDEIEAKKAEVIETEKNNVANELSIDNARAKNIADLAKLGNNPETLEGQKEKAELELQKEKLSAPYIEYEKQSSKLDTEISEATTKVEEKQTEVKANSEKVGELKSLIAASTDEKVKKELETQLKLADEKLKVSQDEEEALLSTKSGLELELAATERQYSESGLKDKIEGLESDATSKRNAFCDASGSCIDKSSFIINVDDISPGMKVSKTGATTTSGVINYALGTIIQTLMIALGSLSLLIMTIGAGYIILHNGQDELLSKGKAIFMSGVIALIVALSSYYIVAMVRFVLFQ